MSEFNRILTSPDPGLAGRIAHIRERVAAAARSAGRAPDDVRVLAVGKTFPPATLAAAAACGLADLGENYLQEALAKIEALGPGGALPCPGLTWHFIGPIQSNKTRPIAENFSWVHTIDRLRIAERLSEQRPAGLPPLQVLVEVNLDAQPSKGGVPPGDATTLALQVAALPRLALRGLMAIPRPETDPALQAAGFARLAHLLEEVRRAVAGACGEAPARQVDTLSMGMSGDFEAAISQGATIVRIGSAIFGARA